jgi:hypothetical protein
MKKINKKVEKESHTICNILCQYNNKGKETFCGLQLN